MGEKRLKMGNKGAEVGRAERRERVWTAQGAERTVVQHFSILSFCLELCSKCSSLVVPVVYENH